MVTWIAFAVMAARSMQPATRSVFGLEPARVSSCGIELRLMVKQSHPKGKRDISPGDDAVFAGQTCDPRSTSLEIPAYSSLSRPRLSGARDDDSTRC